MPVVSEPTFPHEEEWLWFNKYSCAGRFQPMMIFIREYLEKCTEPIVFLTPTTDGIVRDFKEDSCLLAESLYNEYKPKSQYLTFTLCTRGVHDKKIVYLPLDEEAFLHGVNYSVDKRSVQIAWKDKIPVAYWRGGVSGGAYPTIRTTFIQAFRGSKIIDAKLNPRFGTPERLGPISINDRELFDEDRDTSTHLQYKYIFIVDGACIASALQWVFASGSVPILVTHPENEYWFKKYLKPGFHCMIVNYDLSNVEETVQWLIDHDDEAKQIALNAREFSTRVFSPEFQRAHIITEIQRALSA